MPVFFTIVLAILGVLGWIAFNCASKIWFNFLTIRFLAKDIYGVLPMSKRHFIILCFAWMTLPFTIMIPPLFTVSLLLMAWSMQPVFMKSSPEVAYRLLLYTFSMAIIASLAILGCFAFIAAMIMKRDAIRNEKLQMFRQLQMEYDNNAINRII